MSSYLDMMGDLDKIEGKPLGVDSQGRPLFARLLPKALLEMNLEIAINHPECQRLLNEGLREQAYDVETYFGIIFAYCGIALDSTNSPHGYKVDELIEQGTRALISKRTASAVSVNTIPSAQALIGHLLDMKGAGDEQAVLGGANSPGGDSGIVH